MLLDHSARPVVPPAAGVHAFLIADVRGYTRFTQQHGDAAAARLATRFAAVVQEGLAGTDGQLLDLGGDGAAVAFGSVRQALRTALALQERFAREAAADPTLPLHVGMGLDAGEAVAVGEGYRGMALNLAARLCAVAPAGEVLVSEALAHLAGALEGLAYLERGRLPLKGLAEPVHVLQVLPVPFVAVVAAPAERATLESLLADLRARGLACWDTQPVLEPEEGAPGLREGVRACRAVLLVGTPQVGHARPVKGALEIAQLYRRPVVTAWVAGDGPRPESVDTIDLRGERYAAALPCLVARLAQVEDSPGLQAPANPAAPRAGVPAVAPRNPYKGLRAFQGDDAGDFFGRDRLIAQLVAATHTYSRPGATRFVAVVGPSGSGKSSVVLAGLLPQLRRGAMPGSDRWVYLAPLLPGAHPLEVLSIVLNNVLPHSSLTAIRADLEASERGLHLLACRLASHPEGRVVLVVDQAEELFTLTTDEQERRHFIDLLVTAAAEPRGPLLVVLTLRADFYDRPMSYIQLGRLVDAQSVAVLPLEPAELRAAIEGPAALPDVGLRFAGDLVGDLLYEVRDQAGALPLLQFTLDQLFERRDGHLLTEAAYRDLGGVRGALARQAEGTFATLPDDEHRALARALFLRLIEPGASEQDTTRRRAALSELELADPAQSARMREVAEAFIGARLLTAMESGGTTTLEVSHEALIREWERLGEWLREAREDVRLQGRISADAAEWARRERPADSLYRGTVLAEAIGWAERNTPSAREAAFLEAAVAEGRRQEATERERQARELALARRAAMRLRTLVSVLAVFLLAAAGLTALALGYAHQALMAERRAAAARDIALSRQLAAQAVTRLGGQYDLALLLSLEARRVANTVEAHDSLLRSMEAAPQGLIAFLHGQTLAVNSVAMSPNGTILASGSADGTIRLWDLKRRRALGPPLVGHAGAIYSVAFSPDGTVLASGGYDGTVRLWDVARRRSLGPPLRGHTLLVSSLAFSPDGKTLASGSADDTIRLWHLAHHGPLAVSPSWARSGSANGVYSLAFSPAGKVLASGGGDGTVELWDAARGRLLTSRAGQSGMLIGHTDAVTSLAFSPDGKTLASGGFDRTVRLWDVAGRRQLGPSLVGHTDFVDGVAFSPQGSTLASGSLDGTVRLWDVRRRRPLGPPLLSHTGDVNSVVFSSDGTMLAAGTANGTVALWDMRHRQPPSLTLGSGLGVVESMALSPDGKILASEGLDGTLRLWDMTRRTLRRLIPLGGGVTSVALSPDWTMLAVGYSTGGSVQLWDAATGQPFGQSVSTQASGITKVAFSPHGKTVASAGADGTIQFWSVARHPRGLLHPLGLPLAGHIGWVNGLAFSPDGTVLASGGYDGTVRLWDVARRRPLGPPLVGHIAQVDGIAFSPDGTLLASGSDDGRVRLWDVAHRRRFGPLLVGHTDFVDALAFSPDGTILASGSGDHTIRLWDVASGQPLGAPLTGYAGDVTSLAFSPDGTTLVSGSADGTVRLWDVGLDLRTWPSRACRIANRNLTRQEWRQYLGDEPYHKTCPGLPAGS